MSIQIQCPFSSDLSFKNHYSDFLEYQRVHNIRDNCRAMSLILRDFLAAQGYEPQIVDGFITWIGKNNVFHIGFHTWVVLNGRVIEATAQYKAIKEVMYFKTWKSFIKYVDIPIEKHFILLKELAEYSSPLPDYPKGKRGTNKMSLKKLAYSYVKRGFVLEHPNNHKPTSMMRLK